MQRVMAQFKTLEVLENTLINDRDQVPNNLFLAV